jgi:hypothetical protein
LLLTRVALLGDNVQCGQDGLHLGTNELWRSPKRVAVLAQLTLVLGDGKLALLALGKGAITKEIVHDTRGLNLRKIGKHLFQAEDKCMTYLAGMWTSDVVNERIEGRLGTDQCLNTHRSANLTE